VSRARRAGTLGTIAVLSWLPAGCDGTYDLPADVRWQSEHFDYQTRAGDSQICSDVLGPLEQHFALLQDYLGFGWPPGGKVTYEKMRDFADLMQHGGCLPESGGCTLESMIRSPNAMDLHELVHAYLWQTGFPPPVLIEGAAMTIACSPPLSGEKPTESWDQLAALNYDEATRAEAYVAGTWLVGYLLTQYDPRLFTTLYGRLDFTADANAMDAAFREVYGQSLAAIWAAVLADTAPHQVCLWQCSGPPAPVDGTKVATEGGVCGILDTFHSLTVASSSVVGVSSTAASVGLGSCDQTPLDLTQHPPGTLNLYDLPPGSYFVDSSADVGTMTLDASFSSLVTPTCAEETNVVPFAGDSGFTLTGPNTSSQWYLPLPPPPSPTSELLPGFAGGANMKVCGSCDPDSCVDQFQFGSWAWESGQTVSIAVDPFPPGSYFQVSLDWY
jgi:hypothetical protein